MITADIQTKCIYDQCMNQKAFEVGEKLAEAGQTTEIDFIRYQVHTEEVSIELPIIETFCNHEHTQRT